MSTVHGITTTQPIADANSKVLKSTSLEQLIAIPPEPFLIDLFCNWIEEPEAVLIREWGCGAQGVIGSWSIAEFLRDVVDVRRRVWGELSVEERGRLRTGGGGSSSAEEDVFIAVVAGGGYAFVVLSLAIYAVGGVIVPLCRSPFGLKSFLLGLSNR